MDITIISFIGSLCMTTLGIWAYKTKDYIFAFMFGSVAIIWIYIFFQSLAL